MGGPEYFRGGNQSALLLEGVINANLIICKIAIATGEPGRLTECGNKLSFFFVTCHYATGGSSSKILTHFIV